MGRAKANKPIKDKGVGGHGFQTGDTLSFTGLREGPDFEGKIVSILYQCVDVDGVVWEVKESIGTKGMQVIKGR